MIAKFAILVCYLLSLKSCVHQVVGFSYVGAISKSKDCGAISISRLSAVKSIESTPNPLAFKLGLDQQIVLGPGQTFGKVHIEDCPEEIKFVLANSGIESVYAMSDWVCVNKLRSDSHSWNELLPFCVEAFGGAVEGSDAFESLKLLETSQQPLLYTAASDEQISATIRIQSSNGIPIQVEASNGLKTKRQALSQRFANTMEAFITKDDGTDNSRNGKDKFFAGRSWLLQGILYAPSLEEALSVAVTDLEAIYTDDRLLSLVEGTSNKSPSLFSAINLVDLRSLNDKVALLSVEQLCTLVDGSYNSESPDNLREKNQESALIALSEFVQDGIGSISARRMAISYLGSCSTSASSSSPLAQYKNLIFSALSRAFFQEKAANLRRTAGDALSDFGDNRAVPLAIYQLKEDSSKLVRWRAARILGELGGECSSEIISGAIGALQVASLVEGETFEILFECVNSLAILQNCTGNNDKDEGTKKEKNVTMAEWLNTLKKNE